MWRFAILYYAIFSILIFLKNYLIPALLYLTLPISDFRSTLFEIFILLFGVVSGFLFYYLGAYAKFYYKLSNRAFLAALFMIHFSHLTAIGLTLEPNLFQWSILWTDLIGEPFRILTMSYQYSLAVGFIIPLLLSFYGYGKQKQHEERTGRNLPQPTHHI